MKKENKRLEDKMTRTYMIDNTLNLR